MPAANRDNNNYSSKVSPSKPGKPGPGQALTPGKANSNTTPLSLRAGSSGIVPKTNSGVTVGVAKKTASPAKTGSASSGAQGSHATAATAAVHTENQVMDSQLSIDTIPAQSPTENLTNIIINNFNQSQNQVTQPKSVSQPQHLNVQTPPTPRVHKSTEFQGPKASPKVHATVGSGANTATHPTAHTVAGPGQGHPKSSTAVSTNMSN